MKEPPTPVNEDERLQTLQSLNILDSSPEERFDRYTRLAASIFDVPIALVSLVDSQRQWFKSAVGLDVQETPRKISVCGHTILQDKILVIEDLSKDQRFHDNPLIALDPKLRFYAGVPLKPINNHALGSFCLIDYKPRKFTQKNIDNLIDLASMVSDELIIFLDELTGLTNRRGFNLLAHNVLSTAQRSSNPLSLIMLDLDNFKAINDEYGHQSGDQALKVFANCLQEVFRKSDIVSRTGGDEFCILLSNTTRADAELSMTRLQELVAEQNANPNYKFHLAFSAGIADSLKGIPLEIQALLNDADRQLYEAKKAKKLLG